MIFFTNRGIHARLLAGAILVITSSTCILGYMGLNMVNRLVSERFDQQIDYMAKHLAINAELGILIEENALLDGLARSVLNERDVIGVEIEDRKGRCIAQQSRRAKGPVLIVEETVSVSRSDTETSDLEILTGKLNREEIGLVRIKYTREGINHLTKSLAQYFVMLSLGLVMISCVVFFLISRSLVRPIVFLSSVARQVSKGDLTVRAPVGNLPETKKLAVAFNEMLDSIEDNSRKLQNAQVKLSRQEALAEVGKFSMMIAHEVKNPLAIIKSSLDMLKKDLNIPKDNLMLNYTEEELTRLNELIESFLMFARPTKPRMVPTNLNQLSQQVVLGFQLQYRSDTLNIKYAIPDKTCMAMADNDLLARALSNIIRNACDASGNQGQIDIKVKIRHNFWMFYIRDYGKGIDQKNLPRLFEPFYTTKATGTGLGLAFADQVVRAHGGSIAPSNHVDGGAEFCMEIPLDYSNTKNKDYDTNGKYSHR